MPGLMVIFETKCEDEEVCLVCSLSWISKRQGRIGFGQCHEYTCKWKCMCLHRESSEILWWLTSYISKQMRGKSKCLWNPSLLQVYTTYQNTWMHLFSMLVAIQFMRSLSFNSKPGFLTFFIWRNVGMYRICKIPAKNVVPVFIWWVPCASQAYQGKKGL